MPADASLAAELPPRTWRGWWLAWPKWFRIGCWAALGLAVLHIVVAVRIAIGLIEADEIIELRRRGGSSIYIWQTSNWDVWRHPFEDGELLFAGLMGRSGRNVCVIWLDHATDADLELIAKHFPNVGSLGLCGAEATAEGFSKLCACRHLGNLDLTGSNIDDDGMARLAGLHELNWLDLSGTLVSDNSIRSLQKMPSLEIVGLSYTNVTAQAIRSWRAQPRRPSTINTDWDDSPATPFVSVLWSDGSQSDRYWGRYEFWVDGPLPADNEQTIYHAHINIGLLREEFSSLVIAMQQWSDGDYLASFWIGRHESEPVTFHVKKWRTIHPQL